MTARTLLIFLFGAFGVAPLYAETVILVGEDGERGFGTNNGGDGESITLDNVIIPVPDPQNYFLYKQQAFGGGGGRSNNAIAGNGGNGNSIFTQDVDFAVSDIENFSSA